MHYKPRNEMWITNRFSFQIPRTVKYFEELFKKKNKNLPLAFQCRNAETQILVIA